MDFRLLVYGLKFCIFIVVIWENKFIVLMLDVGRSWKFIYIFLSFDYIKMNGILLVFEF